MPADGLSPRRRVAAGLLALTQVGHAHWFFGNLYEAVVNVPDLLARRKADTEAAESGQGEPLASSAPLSPLGPGSPVRYYAASMPAVTPAALAALAFGWNDPATRPWLTASAAFSVFGAASSVYLVRAVNLDLFFSGRVLDAAERERLLRRWYRINTARIAATGAAVYFAHRGRKRLLR